MYSAWTYWVIDPLPPVSRAWRRVYSRVSRIWQRWSIKYVLQNPIENPET